MTPYDFVHLVLLASGDSIKGRTKLQKVVYFVGLLTGQLPILGYRPHYYGPYSPDVAGAVQDLRSLKFLEQHIHCSATTDESGFEMKRYDYSLTPEGKQVAEEKAAQFPEDWKQIADAVGRLNAAGVQDYVRLAIAAKTDLLFRQNQSSLSLDSLREKAAEHGWNAFTDRQYAEALSFLKSVVKGELPPGEASEKILG